LALIGTSIAYVSVAVAALAAMLVIAACIPEDLRLVDLAPENWGA